jgi:hypothetical protein
MSNLQSKAQVSYDEIDPYRDKELRYYACYFEQSRSRLVVLTLLVGNPSISFLVLFIGPHNPMISSQEKNRFRRLFTTILISYDIFILVF